MVSLTGSLRSSHETPPSQHGVRLLLPSPFMTLSPTRAGQPMLSSTLPIPIDHKPTPQHNTATSISVPLQHGLALTPVYLQAWERERVLLYLKNKKLVSSPPFHCSSSWFGSRSLSPLSRDSPVAETKSLCLLRVPGPFWDQSPAELPQMLFPAVSFEVVPFHPTSSGIYPA